MNLQEYEKVRDFTYLEYCDYLQQKYGIGRGNYMTKSWNKNPKVSRTKEGLVAHHKFEDHAIMLADKDFAMKNPFEWQLAENIVYCDYLEHLFLHILICENPAVEKNAFEAVGIGGIVNFLVPELNDVFSGWKTNQTWRETCHNAIKDDKEVYMALLKRFKTTCRKHPLYTENCLYTSFNDAYGLWAKQKIHGFSKKSHNCNPCAQHSNTYQRGLKLKRERGNPSKVPPHAPPPCGGRECRQQNLGAITTTPPEGWCFFRLFGPHRRVRKTQNNLPKPLRRRATAASTISTLFGGFLC